MSAPVYAPITPPVFSWARASAGYTLEEAARLLGRPAEQVRRWEAGEKMPTYVQAKRAAELFHRPTALFFLAEPPRERTLPDLRFAAAASVSGAGAGAGRGGELNGRAVALSPPRQGPGLRYFARQVLLRCEWASPVRHARGEGPVKFAGAAKLSDGPSALARRLRRQLGLRAGALSRCGGAAAAREWLAERIRAAGIFVFVAAADDDAGAGDDWRGMSVLDDYAPAVAFNEAGGDVVGHMAALLAGVARLRLGREGISAGPPPPGRTGINARVERLCARAADEILAGEDFGRAGGESAGAEESAADAPARKLLWRCGRDFAALALSTYYEGGMRPMKAAWLLGAPRRHDLVDDMAREVFG